MSQEDGATTTPGGQEPPAGQEPTTTTSAGSPESKTFDESYVKQLRDEAAANRTALREAQTTLKDLQDRDKSDSEKLSERASTAEQRVAQLEAQTLRFEVAEKKGLTASQARRLIGDTREELLKDADKLLAELGGEPQQKSGGGFDGGARGGTRAASMDDWIRQAAGRS